MTNNEIQRGLASQGAIQKTEDEVCMEKLSYLVNGGVLNAYAAIEAAYKLGKKSSPFYAIGGPGGSQGGGVTTSSTSPTGGIAYR